VTNQDHEKHISVMLSEVLQALNPRDGEVYVDATFGAGGYSKALLDKADCTVYGFDRDPIAIAEAQEWVEHYDGRLILINAPFDQMYTKLRQMGIKSIDGVVFDLGVSSMQLDEAERGFSFRFDGPLSMRMDGAKPDAADVIKSAEFNDLKMIFRVYGEEKRAGNLAKAIIRAREEGPIESTLALARVIEAASPNRYAAKKGRSIHPATRVFQALRIFVNDELGQLARGLTAAEALLVKGGRLIAVTFHSLEARIVKRFLSDRSGQLHSSSRHLPQINMPDITFTLPFRGQKKPRDGETQNNIRARSAALRVGLRTEKPGRLDDLGFADLFEFNFSKSMMKLEVS